MVVRESASVQFIEALPRRFVLTHFRPDRSAPDRGMDFSRQTRRPFPASDAQVHLDADPARSVNAARTRIVILSEAKDLALEACDTQNELRDRAPNGRSLTPFGMTTRGSQWYSPRNARTTNEGFHV